MSLDKYRYEIYPDRIYFIRLATGVAVEIKGSELITMMGLDSYVE